MALFRTFRQCLLRSECWSIGKIPNVIACRSYKRWVSPVLKEIHRRKQLTDIKPIKRNTFIEWNRDAELTAFANRLHENFDSKILRAAFVHPSYIMRTRSETGNDAFDMDHNTELITSGEIFLTNFLKSFMEAELHGFPTYGIQNVTTYLMNHELLAKVSTQLGTKDLILTGDDVITEYTLATTLKAIIGALLKSSGSHRAGEFIKDFITTQLNAKDLNSFWMIEKPIKMLEKLLRDMKRGPLEPRLLNDAGSGTVLATYNVGIYSDQELIGRGCGENLSLALELAAQNSLKKLLGIKDSYLFKSNGAKMIQQIRNNIMHRL